MFGFDRDEDGSEDRYYERKARWASARASVWIHFGWWLVHNLVAHPLIGVAPVSPTFRFHDWTSHKMQPPRRKKRSR